MKRNIPDNQDNSIELIPDKNKSLDRAKRQARAANLRWDILFRAAADPVIIGDEEGILVCNPCFEELTGLTSEKIIGISISDLPMCSSDPEDCANFMKYWRDPAHTGRRFPWIFINSFGKKIVLDMQIRFVTIEGNIFRFCIGRDVTHETELLQEQKIALQQIDKNLAQLAALNDEIRNPLTLISMSAGMDLHSDHNKILEGVNMINNLVDRLDQGFTESEKVRRFLKRTITDFAIIQEKSHL